jgi:hypothetical protein
MTKNQCGDVRIKMTCSITVGCLATVNRGYLDCNFADRGKRTCKWRKYSLEWDGWFCTNPTAIGDAFSRAEARDALIRRVDCVLDEIFGVEVAHG